MSNPQSKSVYDYLAKKIKNNFWKPGDKIYSEKKLCEEVGVSRIAVREALEKLVALGVIVKKKGSGAYVADLNLKGYMDSIFHFFSFTKAELMMYVKFRMHLEKGNMIEFIENHTDDDMVKLNQCHENMIKFRDDKERFLLEDGNFHRILAEGTKNQVIVSIYSMVDKILSNDRETTMGKADYENVIKHHGLLIEAINENNKDFAVMLMERHCRSTLEAIDKFEDEIV